MKAYESKCACLFNINPVIFSSLNAWLRPWLPLVPQAINIEHLNTVLDVGCGLHQWGKDLFDAMLEQGGVERVREVHIDGVECHSAVISYIPSQLSASASRGQIQAHLADMFHLPETLHQRYDLVHARFLSPYVSAVDWPTLLDQLVQAACPGGWVVWIEPDLPTPVQDVPAWNRWLGWLEQAVQHLEGSPGISAGMDALFRRAGTWEQVEKSITTIPLGFSAGGQEHVPDEQVRLLRQRLEALSTILLATGVVASIEQIHQTLWHVLDAFAKHQLQSTWTWHTVYGKKPSAGLATFERTGGRW